MFINCWRFYEYTGEMLAAFVFITQLMVFYTTAEFTRLQVTDSWNLYFSRSENDCSMEEQLRQFPEVYSTDSGVTEIGPPVNFTVTYFENTIAGGRPNYFYPGMMVEFSQPEIGLEHLRGYELRVTWKTFTACFLYVLNRRPDHVMEHDRISTELFPVTEMTSYWFVLTSLPVHNSNQSSDPTQLVTSHEHERDPTGKLPEPADWYAHISYDVIKLNGSRSLQIVFSRPPPEYGFQRFQIALVPVEDYIHVRFTITSQYYHEFEDIEIGHYKISIKAIDEYFSQSGRCLCRYHHHEICTNCLSSETAIFTVD